MQSADRVVTNGGLHPPYDCCGKLIPMGVMLQNREIRHASHSTPVNGYAKKQPGCGDTAGLK